MGEAMVLTQALERDFGSVRALAGVSLEVAEGEVYGFLGPNGAGKTTLVRILCTLLRPSGGRALVAGHDVSTEAQQVRLEIGVALQQTAVDSSQTGRELLHLQARLYGLSATENDRALTRVLELIDIGEAVDRRISTYSGGMKRRLDVAAALVHSPRVLFLDEPTVGLDPLSRAAVWAEVVHLNRELGMTVFLTTQYLDEADQLADRVGIIDGGRVVAEGTPEELKRAIGEDLIVADVEHPDDLLVAALREIAGIDGVTVKGDELSIRTSQGSAALAPVAVALSREKANVRSVTLRTPTLDDVFLEVTGARMGRQSGVATRDAPKNGHHGDLAPATSPEAERDLSSDAKPAGGDPQTADRWVIRDPALRQVLGLPEPRSRR